ncbi:protein of unknown function [Methanoculleus bourgensis]|uniref:Uncharacterized protein n=1 Tax=Methanoculleus bourgensis TaxID=83986 RepID=A0A0X3BII8_9EURY|nr:protein of unknown function [Methanoculleus bourgensis]
MLIHGYGPLESLCLKILYTASREAGLILSHGAAGQPEGSGARAGTGGCGPVVGPVALPPRLSFLRTGSRRGR